MKENNHIRRALIWVLGLLCVMKPVTAQAQGWMQKADGSAVYTDKSGNELESRYDAAGKLGIVKKGDDYYCYRLDGSGQTGQVKVGGDWFYFGKSDGKMLTCRRIKIKKKYYYFGEDGRRVARTWVGRRYYGKNGAQVFGRFVGKRYVDAKGLYIRGKKTIKGKLYYFDRDTGLMLTDTVKKLNGKDYYFDSSGVGRRSSPSGTIVETAYFSDPKVDDETLLSAIIYCEAGNQPYYGQLAVGLVVMNRVKSSLFPSDMRDVIYAKDQFEPARNSWLTMALQGRLSVTASCRQAAREAIRRSGTGDLKITNTDTGKTVNMKGYLFFMTPAAYRRLQLKSAHIVLRDHVFFKKWKR